MQCMSQCAHWKLNSGVENLVVQALQLLKICLLHIPNAPENRLPH